MTMRLLGAGLALATAALLTGPADPTATAAPSAQVQGWLAEMLAASEVSTAGFHSCSDASAACHPAEPGLATSFATPTGAAACSAVGPPDTGTFTCAVADAQFPLPTKPEPSHGQWVASYIARGENGWRIGNYADTVRVAAGPNPLAYHTRVVLSTMKSQTTDQAPKLECGSFPHGLVCLDRMWGHGFHASRDDFTSFTFPPTAP